MRAMTILGAVRSTLDKRLKMTEDIYRLAQKKSYT